MVILTAYGEFNTVDTATGIRAISEYDIDYFVDGISVPNPDHTSDLNRLIAMVESEYEFQHDINN